MKLFAKLQIEVRIDRVNALKLVIADCLKGNIFITAGKAAAAACGVNQTNFCLKGRTICLSCPAFQAVMRDLQKPQVVDLAVMKIKPVRALMHH